MNKLRKLAFKLRGGVWTALFIAILIVAKPTNSSMFWGLSLVVLGQILRFWAVGTIQKYRGEEVKADRLVTWGAYSLARNPLYVANGLIGAGWSIMAGGAAFIIFAVTYIVLYVWLIIPHEEDFLRGKFGVEYVDYCRKTGRFFPKSMPCLGGSYSPQILLKSERHSLIMTIVGSILILLKGFF